MKFLCFLRVNKKNWPSSRKYWMTAESPGPWAQNKNAINQPSGWASRETSRGRIRNWLLSPGHFARWKIFKKRIFFLNTLKVKYEESALCSVPSKRKCSTDWPQAKKRALRNGKSKMAAAARWLVRSALCGNAQQREGVTPEAATVRNTTDRETRYNRKTPRFWHVSAKKKSFAFR